MGEELTRKLGQPAVPPVRNPKPEPAAGRTDPRPERPAGDSRPRNPAAGNSRSGNGDGAGKAEEKKTSGLAPVTAAVPETPKKKQQRKPRKAKKEESSFNAEQISALILSTSTIIASRPDMAVWALRPEEATQLATPIANMIQKSEALQKMGEYSDAIALVTASLVIFAPRAMVYHDQQKQKKAAKGVIKRVEKGKSESSNGKSDGGSNERNSTNVPKHDSSIFAAIPATI